MDRSGVLHLTILRVNFGANRSNRELQQITIRATLLPFAHRYRHLRYSKTTGLSPVWEPGERGGGEGHTAGPKSDDRARRVDESKNSANARDGRKDNEISFYYPGLPPTAVEQPQVCLPTFFCSSAPPCLSIPLFLLSVCLSLPCSLFPFLPSSLPPPFPLRPNLRFY